MQLYPADNQSMKRTTLILIISFVTIGFCAAQEGSFHQEGIASWYGPEFDGRPTASGEIFNSSRFTAAHPTLPFGTELKVTNRHNNKTVIVTVNDRGPFVSARIIDLSKAAAAQLDMLSTGTAPVLVESTGRIVNSDAAVHVIPAPVELTEREQASPPPDPLWVTEMADEEEIPEEPAYITEQSVSESAPLVIPELSSIPAALPDKPVTPPPDVDKTPVTQAPAAPAPVLAPTPVVSAPVVSTPAVPAPAQTFTVTLIPAITPAANKVYRLQVGAYKIARNAVEAFDKLKNAGLFPAYERNGELFRVVLSGIRGDDVKSITEKIGSAGFKEALIREEK
jgi:rare lipoprotein A